MKNKAIVPIQPSAAGADDPPRMGLPRKRPDTDASIEKFSTKPPRKIVSVAEPYESKLKLIQKLDRSILKITPSAPVHELEGYKNEMNRILEFLEEEKMHLDRLAEQGSLTQKSKGCLQEQKEELALSDEIDRIKAEALMASVEADLQMDAILLSEEDAVREGTCEQLYRCYRRYNQSLDTLLKKCRAYKTILQPDPR